MVRGRGRTEAPRRGRGRTAKAAPKKFEVYEHVAGTEFNEARAIESLIFLGEKTRSDFNTWIKEQHPAEIEIYTTLYNRGRHLFTIITGLCFDSMEDWAKTQVKNGGLSKYKRTVKLLKGLV